MMNSNFPTTFRNLILVLISLLSTLYSAAYALELSDIHMPMKRDDADTTLSKDYTYSVMTDGSVRRTWKLNDKEVIIDFDTVSNDAIMVAVIYDKPISKKKGIADAHTLAAGKYAKDATWDSPKDRDAKGLIENTYGLKNARRKKLDDKSMLFYETNAQKNRIVRVSLFARMPQTNRWALTTLTRNSGKTAMGNQMSSNFITSLYDDEARRQEIPLDPSKISSASKPHDDDDDDDDDEEDDDEAATPTPRISVTVTQKSIPAPTRTKPATPAPKVKPTAPSQTPAPRVANTTAPSTPTPAPATATTTTTHPAQANSKPATSLEPGRHTMSLLPPPPTWLKAAGIEEPTWWHYLGVGFVILLIVIFIIHTLMQNAGRAAQRKRFVDVVSQTPAATSKSRVRRR